MTAKVVILQHVAMEGPARLALAAERAGLPVQTVKLFEGEAVPLVSTTDVLVLMGGPMGVGDIGSSQFPFLQDEVQLLRQRIDADAPTLGICLGAQLLAHAAGARVYPNTSWVGGHEAPIIELGWSPVAFYDQSTEPALAELGAQQMVLHWHGDTFDLPLGARLLASTKVCKHQAFRLATRLFGLQFHCEADPATVAQWVQQDVTYVRKALGPQGPALVIEQTMALTQSDRDKGDRFLDNIFKCMLAR